MEARRDQEASFRDNYQMAHQRLLEWPCTELHLQSQAHSKKQTKNSQSFPSYEMNRYTIHITQTPNQLVVCTVLT